VLRSAISITCGIRCAGTPGAEDVADAALERAFQEESMSTKSRMLGVALALVVSGTAVGSAHAQSACNSGAKVLDAVWAQWGERLKAKNCKNSEECLANAQKKEDLYKRK
jgi:hypothetical protein